MFVNLGETLLYPFTNLSILTPTAAFCLSFRASSVTFPPNPQPYFHTGVCQPKIPTEFLFPEFSGGENSPFQSFSESSRLLLCCPPTVSCASAVQFNQIGLSWQNSVKVQDGTGGMDLKLAMHNYRIADIIANVV